MRPLLTALLVAATVAGGPRIAVAVETPKPGSADTRVRTIEYDPQQVVRITGVIRTATQILFSPEETILHVALGDASGWEVAPERNVLFAKPVALRRPTNLIVTTERPGGVTRHYHFELTTRGGPSGPGSVDTVFAVQFRYPADERRILAQAISAETQALEARILQLRLERGVLEGARNLAYSFQGSAAISPSEVTDNGRFTVLRFPGAQPVPAVYAIAPDGSETLVPFDVRGEFLVIHAVMAQLRLRRGREVLCIFNTALRPLGSPSGTAAPDVTRTITEGTHP